MSAIVDALLAELDDDDNALDQLAELLRPRLAVRQEPRSGWLRGAAQIADYIGAPRSRVYELSSAGRIPIERDGSSLVAKTEDLDRWLRDGGARRT